MRNILKFIREKMYLVKIGLFFALIFSSMYSVLSCCDFNRPSHLASILYGSNILDNDETYLRISPKNISFEDDYYFNDYQYSFNAVETLRTSSDNKDEFIFRCYEAVEDSKNKIDGNNRVYGSTIVFNNFACQRFVTPISFRLIKNNVSLFENTFGIKLLCDNISPFQNTHGVVISYPMAVDYLKIFKNNFNPTENDFRSLLGESIEFADNSRLQGNSPSSFGYIIGILKPIEDMTECKIPKGLGEFCFASNTFEFRTGCSIYAKLSRNEYKGTMTIKKCYNEFNRKNDFSLLSKQFQSVYEFRDMNENVDFFPDKTDSFNNNNINCGYLSLFILFAIILCISIVLCVIFVEKKEINLFFKNDFANFLIAVSISLLFTFLFNFIFELIGKLVIGAYTIYSATISQVIVFSYFALFIAYLLIKNKKKVSD